MEREDFVINVGILFRREEGTGCGSVGTGGAEHSARWPGLGLSHDPTLVYQELSVPKRQEGLGLRCHIHDSATESSLSPRTKSMSSRSWGRSMLSPL